MPQYPHLMSLVDHLGELRRCLIHSLIAIFIVMAINLYFSKDLFNILTRPLDAMLPRDSHFIATTPFESYMVYLKTSALAAFLLVSPYIALQIWRFISPALYQNEKRTIL